MTDPAAQVPRKRSDLEVVDVAGQLVIWDPTADRVHRLDPIASLVWTHLDGNGTVAELAGDVADTFEQPLAVVVAALTDLFAGLRDAGLLAPPT